MPHSDEYSLLRWLKDRSLEAHNTECVDCPVFAKCTIELTGREACVKVVEERVYDRVIAYIEQGRANQRPHISPK